MKKILLIVNRYGKEIVGGAELHARLLAEHLQANGNTVEVITSCAIDYITWKNHYKAGEEIIDNILVHRFKVDKPRNFRKYSDIEAKALYNPSNLEYGEMWEKEQGPYSSDL